MRRLLPLALCALAVLPASAPAAAPAGGSAIVGGKETDRHWPWMVYVELGRQEIDNEFQICGGSLISSKWVLTAAHCILVPEAVAFPIYDVVIGRHAKSDTGTGERIQARRVIVNPDYESNGDDVALMELERAPANATPLKIAGPGEEPFWNPGVMATVLGWGATSDGGDASDVLKEAQVPVVSDVDCGRAYSDEQWEWDPAIMVCAGYPEGGTDTCQGDSGGPMIVPAADGSWRQVGATSFGEGCAQPGWPGVYAEVAGPKIRDWIAGHVPDAVAPPWAPPAPAPPPPAQQTTAPQAPAPASGSPGPASARRESAAKRRRAKCRRARARARTRAQKRRAAKICRKARNRPSRRRG